MNSAPLCVFVVAVVVVISLSFSSLLRPVCLLFVFSLPFLLPALLRSSSEAVWLPRPPVALGEIVVSHHSRWYQWLWVTQLESNCVLCVLWGRSFVHMCVCLFCFPQNPNEEAERGAMAAEGQRSGQPLLSRASHIDCTLRGELWSWCSLTFFAPCTQQINTPHRSRLTAQWRSMVNFRF